MLPDPRPYFADLPDPRRETKNKLHKLHDILMIVLCAVVSGIDDWVGMEAFAEEKEAWLRGFLELPTGVPSHDTLSDVIGRLDPKAFASAFANGMHAALPHLAGEHVAFRWQEPARQLGRQERGAPHERLCHQRPTRLGATGRGGQVE